MLSNLLSFASFSLSLASLLNSQIVFALSFRLLRLPLVRRASHLIPETSPNFPKRIFLQTSGNESLVIFLSCKVWMSTFRLRTKTCLVWGLRKWEDLRLFGFLRSSVNFVIHTGERQQWGPPAKSTPLWFDVFWCQNRLLLNQPLPSMSLQTILEC